MFDEQTLEKIAGASTPGMAAALAWEAALRDGNPDNGDLYAGRYGCENPGPIDSANAEHLGDFVKLLAAAIDEELAVVARQYDEHESWVGVASDSSLYVRAVRESGMNLRTSLLCTGSYVRADLVEFSYGHFSPSRTVWTR